MQIITEIEHMIIVYQQNPQNTQTEKIIFMMKSKIKVTSVVIFVFDSGRQKLVWLIFAIYKKAFTVYKVVFDANILLKIILYNFEFNFKFVTHQNDKMWVDFKFNVKNCIFVRCFYLIWMSIGWALKHVYLFILLFNI